MPSSKLGKPPPNAPPTFGPRNSSMPNLQAPHGTHMRSTSAGPVQRSPADSSRHPHPPNTSLAAAPAAPAPTAAHPTHDAKVKRRNWFSGMSKDKGGHSSSPVAWIAGQSTKVPYNADPLIKGDRVMELWDESGDTFIYLFPRSSGKGPAFQVQSAIYSSSAVFTRLAFGNESTFFASQSIGADSAAALHQQAPATPPMTPIQSQQAFSASPEGSIHIRSRQTSVEAVSRQYHLYLGGDPNSKGPATPLRHDQYTLDSMVAVRNLFAFLVGQSLIATERSPTIFSIFLNISSLLNSYGFTNFDGSTYGELAASSFDRYCDELYLYDIKSSREKTIETLVLGERMRSIMLYNESFTHAAGKYNAIQQIASFPETGAKFKLVSSVTRNRLERASIDLSLREKSTNMRLLDFDFPSIFAGVMNSKTVTERKFINFEAWKTSFSATRRHVLAYYKQRFGAWPPKSSSKKNDFETGGLNRLVLKELYLDFCSMYDLYVDRTSLTPRSMGQLYSEFSDHQETKLDSFNKPIAHILRRVCDEYDRSSPPVQPPVPFDIPLLPCPIDTGKGPDSKGIGGAAYSRTKKLQQDETFRVLKESTNSDSRPRQHSPLAFLTSITTFELHQARGCTISELVDLRAGMWIFMYAVLQALPMLVIDAPALHCHHGVEYFLCQPPRGGLPWVKALSDSGVKGKFDRSWYRVSGSNGMVNLPSDLVEHGVEGVYRRSHCWLRASQWNTQLLASAIQESPESERRSRAVRRSFEQGLPPPPQLIIDQTGQPNPMNFHMPTPVSAPGSVSAPSSRPSSRAASPGVATRTQPTKQRETSVDLGLETLTIPSNMSPAAEVQNFTISQRPRSSSPASRDGGPIQKVETAPVAATTFDDIIGSMNKTKKQK